MQLFYPPEMHQRVARWEQALELMERPARPEHQDGFYLWFDGGRLRLYQDQDPHGICLLHDALAPRMAFATALARACGVSSKHRPHVFDAMAGLGTDAMTLAGLGCAVTLFERQPALWALLDDFLIANPMPQAHLHRGDSMHWLARQREPVCDTLYLDPLFPSRAKKALPGKAMQYVRALSGSPEDVPIVNVDWLASLAGLAHQRVVLKRRLRDAVLGDPAWQIKGRTVRYDVYRGSA